MKVIEGMKPSAVLKAVEDGETNVAWFNAVTKKWVKWESESHSVKSVAAAIGNGYLVGIIDNSHPVIDWDGFDWEFFTHDQSLTVMVHQGDSNLPCLMHTPPKGDNVSLRQSPFYSWFGGKQPLPDNVEVQIEKVTVNYSRNGTANSINRKREVLLAKDVVWDWRNVIAFRLTGKVL